MYAFDYHRPASVAEAVSLLQGAADGKLLAGGQTLIPTLKQRLAQPVRRHRSGRRSPSSRGSRRRAAASTIGAHDHARRGRRARRWCKRSIPALAELAEHDRRPAGAQPRHDRRLDRQQRSGRRLSRRGAGPQRHGPHQQARDRRRRLLHRHVRDRARPTTRSSPRCASPSRRRRATRSSRNPASRYAIVGVFVAQDRRRRAGRGDRRRPLRVPGRRHARARLPATSRPQRSTASQRQAGRPQQRHPRQRRVPRASGQGHGQARGRRRELNRTCRIGRGSRLRLPFSLAPQPVEHRPHLGRAAVRGGLPRLVRGQGALLERGRGQGPGRLRLQLRDAAVPVPADGARPTLRRSRNGRSSAPMRSARW